MDAVVAADNISLIYNETSINVVDKQSIRKKAASYTGIVLLEGEKSTHAYTLQNLIHVNPLGRTVKNQTRCAAGYRIFLKERTQQ